MGRGDGGIVAPVDRPALSMTEAAEAAGVSRDTIERRRKAGDFPGARMDQGRWVIPVDDLLGAGLVLHAPAPPETGPGGEMPAGEAGELERLRAEVAAVRHEAALWRAVAEERARAVELAELALRALPAAPTPPVGPVGEREAGWWRRRRRAARGPLG